MSSGVNFPSHFELLNAINCELSCDQKTLLDAPFTEKEIVEAVFSMEGLKALGPDGLTAAFYRRHWRIVGNSVREVVLSVLNSSVMPKELNQTFFALIPKSKASQTINDIDQLVFVMSCTRL